VAERRRPRAPEVLAGRRPVLESLRAGQPCERILIARELAPSAMVGDIRRRAEGASIPVRVVVRAEIDKLAAGINHQGVVALTPRYRYASLESLLGAPSPAVLFLDHVMDPQNVGSLLRSAEGAGFAGVVIPARRAASVTPAVRRASSGASETMRVARVANLAAALESARRAGLWAVGLDQDAAANLWSSRALERPVALVLGAEDRGLSKAVRGSCDEIVAIPTRGRIGSLNVASAGAIAMFEVSRRAGL
jgi:23S rRNA (guanosine2251-2'-O)-methyltransferase